MPAKVDISDGIKTNNNNPEIDLEKGDQPRRHRWGYIDEENPLNSEDHEYESREIRDVFRATCSILFFVAFIMTAAGVIPWVIFGFIAGFIFIVNSYLAFTGITYNAIRHGVLSVDEFYGKMDAIYAADAQLRWTIQCYHNKKTYYTMWETNPDTGVKTSKGGGQTKKRVNTHKASMDLDYYKCNDLSIHVSPADIKEGNLYRFVIMKKIRLGDEQIVKDTFVNQHKNRDKYYDLSEDFTIPGYNPTFLVATGDKTLPFFLTPTWYIICSLTILLTVPYEVYLCSKTKAFPIEVVKEFWVYPESHQQQQQHPPREHRGRGGRGRREASGGRCDREGRCSRGGRGGREASGGRCDRGARDSRCIRGGRGAGRCNRGDRGGKSVSFVRGGRGGRGRGGACGRGRGGRGEQRSHGRISLDGYRRGRGETKPPPRGAGDKHGSK